ncbi:hypothetical protein FRX31_006666 [Thalictrum thalictroides]|uniref:Uncharacterized protein n=1 Tax=Thalictrum thalictroides TaxID=46969 RepID=A0A7J6X3W0_THATH|nr:hypothetical protein FRX31_006666 [Thalictrum thalictroides]
MGSFTNRSGETYEFATFASQEPDATVIQPLASNSKIDTSATRSSRQRSGLSHVTPSRSSRSKSSLFDRSESAKRSKRKYDNQPVGSMNQYSHDSTGRGASGVSSLG